MVASIVFIVLMVIWIAFGLYTTDRNNRVELGGNLIPWLCVAILGYLVISGHPVVVQQVR